MKSKFPLGIQTFSEIISGNYLYVDKTSLVYELTHTKRAVFLSRPRRFGKSLLLSAIKYYFLGRKDLFSGLAIEQLEEQGKDSWAEYPVMYFSLASGEFMENDGLRHKIANILSLFEETYQLPEPKSETTLPVRFSNDLIGAFKKTGRKVVVLVDEYDNPLLKNMTVNPQQEEANRNLYKAFFATLKDCDEYLRFYMFT